MRNKKIYTEIIYFVSCAKNNSKLQKQLSLNVIQCAPHQKESCYKELRDAWRVDVKRDLQLRFFKLVWLWSL